MPTKQPLPAQPSFPQMEEEVLAYWQKTKAFEKSVEMRSADKAYIFYDGPPFATGLPHYGHLLGSTSKDVIPRYWTMKGYRVERIWGWDCHGLPIEHMIEKKLKITGGKKGIEKLGIHKFNEACRSEVLRLDTEWEKIIARLGRWVDFKNNYKTMDTSYMESVWWGFKQLFDKGLVYEGKKVILYCPRCATPLSNFEIAMDNSYQTVTEPSNTYKYKLKAEENTYILAWSTTPWNKLATPALAVHPTLKYVKVKQGTEFYVLAESTLKILSDESYEIVKTYSGKDLEKFEFELHYDFYPRSQGQKAGVIVADEFVTAEEGTGVVTLAVYGEDDYRVMKAHNIQMVEHVDDEGKLKPEVTQWAGMNIQAVNPLVNADLAERGLLYSEEPHTHSVAECYRCSTRLYYAPMPAWFINVQELKQDLLEHNESINWFPKHLKHGRFKHGLETAPDWNISRSRYWGTPMPIWESADKKLRRIVGSVAELQEWAVDPAKAAAVTDIHPEFLSDIELWVDAERTVKGTRISEVFDCWVESGSMPFAHRHYPFANKKQFEATYPAQFISEYIAQTRAWFYTMHVMSVGVFGKPAFENVLTTGTILAEDGSKMSKSKNNYPDPMVLIDKYGVDSLRLYLMSSTVMKSENLNFSEKEVGDIRKKVFLIWWNMYAFYHLYAPFEAQEVAELPPLEEVTDVMDRWVLSRLATVTLEVTKAFDSYNTIKASRPLMEFVNELSTWYLRRSRERLKDNQTSLRVFGHVLYRLAQLFAPLAPFFSENIYQRVLNTDLSVHHTDWPVLDASLRHPKLETNMTLIRSVVERVHAARSEAGIKVRQPLANVAVTAPSKPEDNLLAVLLEEVNVKTVKWTVGSDLTVNLNTELTPELEAEGKARELIRSIQKLRKEAGLQVGMHATVTVPMNTISEEWQNRVAEITCSTILVGDDLKISTES